MFEMLAHDMGSARITFSIRW